MNGPQAPPGNGEGPPPQTDPANHLTSPTKSTPTIRQGTDDAAHRAAELLASAWGPALERAHRLGWETGYRRGYQDGKREEHNGWMAALGACRRTLRQPTHAELVARRATDRACVCGNCSACVRRAAVERNRARYGADDYPGQVAS